MDLWSALIFGIVEGVTEFLPVSSTGHLILTAELLGVEQSGFLKSFEIVIQLGAILAVIVLYWKTLVFDMEVIKRVALAFLPTAVVGLILYKTIKDVLMGDQVVVWALLVGGIVLIVFELVHKNEKFDIEDIREMPYFKAFFIGIFQSISIIPGVSRAAATIVGGLMLGLSRKTIVEFSFLLAVPTMLAATGWDMFKNAAGFTSGQFLFLSVGFVSSFVVALFSIKFLLGFVQKNNFVIFGVYRIIVALIFLFFVQ